MLKVLGNGKRQALYTFLSVITSFKNLSKYFSLNIQLSKHICSHTCALNVLDRIVSGLSFVKLRYTERK